jgi:hypothetical protein
MTNSSVQIDIILPTLEYITDKEKAARGPGDLPRKGIP